ncbi:response regulator [Calidithermus timidus]|jgi:response regulator of citrate/malate metabolism|uniref:response regulator n=1 Tax=Calidithermus timidus TaxID=307124 RepID=UPI00035D178C|nr:response regulator [Calidithermus timidus]
MSAPTRVMLVEDDAGVLAVNQAMIASLPHFTVVATAQGVGEGLELAVLVEPELLLVDVYLPDGTGLELIHALRRRNLSFEAIMITAANDLDTVQQALYQGVMDYLIKPFQQPRLHEALERYRQRQSIKAQPLTQAHLDRLLGVRGQQRPPKGIDPTTLEQIQRLLQSAPRPLSADEVGEGVGVSRVTAWRYLEYLQQSGFVQLELSYGAVGRPVKRYRLQRGR